MRWFKHLSQSHTDEKLAYFLSECGLEGYGFWWLLMEVVAEQCTEDKCSATYTLPHWSRLLYSHHNKVSKYLGKLEVIGMVTVELQDGKLRVIIPNLLKYRDEYTRKSGQKQDIIRSKKQIQIQIQNKEEDIIKDCVVKTREARFITPSIEEVKAYCEERGNTINAQHWYDHYSSNGWKVGSNKMKDWQAAVRTWEQKQKGYSNGQSRTSGGSAQTGKKTGIVEANGAGTDFLS